MARCCSKHPRVHGLETTKGCTSTFLLHLGTGGEGWDLCPEPCQHLASVVIISLLPPSSGDSRTWINCEQKRTRSKPWSHLRWFQSARAEPALPELNQGYPEATGALSHLCPRTWLLVLQSKSTQQDLAQRLPHGRDAPSPTAGTEASQGVRHVPSSPPAAAGRSRGHRMASKPSTRAK